jgi:predicted metal-dependent hydrolase
MDPQATDYDRRYLGGILFFNSRDFFEAHEVWEGLWLESPAGPGRRFIQGLIQAAVALYHFGNGNFRGARKLYQTSRAYMEACGSHYLGLDSVAFWNQMKACFCPILQESEPDRQTRPDQTLMPVIELNPSPLAWPSREEFESEEQDEEAD